MDAQKFVDERPNLVLLTEHGKDANVEVVGAKQVKGYAAAVRTAADIFGKYDATDIIGEVDVEPLIKVLEPIPQFPGFERAVLCYS